MIRPDFRDFSIHDEGIMHSPKGTTWKDHKYIKKINGVYYYAKDKISDWNQKREEEKAFQEDVKREKEYEKQELRMLDLDEQQISENQRYKKMAEWELKGRQYYNDALEKVSSFLDQAMDSNAEGMRKAESEIKYREKNIEDWKMFEEKDMERLGEKIKKYRGIK